jgi:Asp-tRNA(Asn)/Glu-tRNA(Gln) amidotransferase B subunit
MAMRFMMKVMTRSKRSKYKPNDWLCFEDPRVEEVERTTEFVQRVTSLHIEEPFREMRWWETNSEEAF